MLVPFRVLILLVSLAPAAGVAWPSTSRAAEPGMLSICTNCWPLSSPYPGALMAADGAGGTYVAWMDGRPRWRLQRLRADLSIPKGWPAAGLAIPAERVSSRIHPILAADGSGGVYVAWAEQAQNGDMSVWLTRVRPDGRTARGWPDSGLCVSAPRPLAWYPVVAKRGNGVAVAWFEAGREEQSIRVVGYDASGRAHPRWPAEGHRLPVSGSMSLDFVLLANDGRAGLYVGWVEMQERLSDLKVAHVPESGGSARSRTLVSRAVPPHATLMDDHPEMVADGLGGAILSWADERRQERDGRHLVDVFGQRIASLGEELWTAGSAGSHAVAAGFGYQIHPHVVSDGNGGAFYSWNEHGPLAATSGRLLRLDAQGRPAPGWPAGGVALGLEVAGLAPDLEGGVIATWLDSAGTHLQRFDSRWSPEIEARAFDFGRVEGRTNVRIASDGRGGAFMAWELRSKSPPTPGSFQSEVRIQHLDLRAGIASPIIPLPTEPALAFAVHPIAPNPARAPCRISFDLPRPARVDVEVFDIAGRRVARLAHDQAFEAGPHSLTWDLGDRRGRPVPAGLYLVRVSAERDRAVARVTVTR